MENKLNTPAQIKLTPREKEVIELIIKEYSTIEIAKAFSLSTETITTHRNNIRRKLKVKNVAGIVRKTILLNLIPERMNFDLNSDETTIFSY